MPILENLIRSKWPLRQHATFDKTLGDYLGIYERVNKRTPLSETRWNFDHAELGTSENLKRVRDLGGGIAIQHRVAFHREYGVKFYGADRMKFAPPVAHMMEMGILVGAGTDATRDTSYNPWICLYWLTSGRTIGGLAVADPSNRLSRMEGLRLYTRKRLVFRRAGSQGHSRTGQICGFGCPL